MLQPPPPPQLVVNLPAIPGPPDYSTVNVVLVALAVMLAITTVVLAVFAIVAAFAAVWGKSEIKTLILAKAAEVAESAANKRIDAFIREQSESATIEGSVTIGRTPQADETEKVGDPYPGEGE